MAHLTAIAAVADAVREYLDLRWKAAPIGGLNPTFEVCSMRRAAQLALDNEPDEAVIGLVVERIEVDHGLRNHRQTGGYDADQEIPLVARLLTFVIPVAPAEARCEQILGTWLLRELLVHPSWTYAELPPEAGFAYDDSVCLHEDPLGADDMRRFWDGLKAPVRMCYGWQLRTVPVERERAPDHPSVIEREFRAPPVAASEAST